MTTSVPKNIYDSITGSNEKLRQLKDFTAEIKPDSHITSYFGTKISDTDNSTKAGARGHTLLEDFHNREKISHFDHERIPERVVHARGAAAHGQFKLHTPIPEFTTAKVLTDTSRTTPMFVRFSTVVGSRGSADTVRDVRGFAVRFYTPEGNWDIVGNNIPVFFIQDAIKFPDLIHAVKPEPDREIPQAQSAHDNSWDFLSLMPESTHMQMWHLSDRTIPRSFRMMQGFGVNTFVLVNAEGKRSFVKFHWRPHLGVHSLVWDEALKLAGQDPDFHRRDLWEAIEMGAYPKWEFGVQIVPEEDEHKFDFDLLDATKIIPEDIVPVKEIGTLTLNRNPAEYFPETEQVAFCTQHIVPGIDFSADPLLQGRHFSYFDTQISRLGGPNFGDLPINRPVCPVMNNQRDGMYRYSIRHGPNYWPNRHGAPHPLPDDPEAYHPSIYPVEGMRVRARGPKFADYLSQAQLFYNSLSDVEKEHLISAASFELGKCDDPVVHQNFLKRMNEIDHTLCAAIAANFSYPVPEPVKPNPGYKSSFLSQHAKSNTFTAAGRKVGILVFDGFNTAGTLALMGALQGAGVIPVVVGPRKGKVFSESKDIDAQFTIETCRSTHFDGIFFPGGDEKYVKGLRSGRVIHFAREAYMHYKAIGAADTAVEWLNTLALPASLTSVSTTSEVANDHGVVTSNSTGPALISAFLDGLAKHRAWDRDVSLVAA